MICVCDEEGASSRVVEAEAEHGTIGNVGKAGITSDNKKNLTCKVHNDVAITNVIRDHHKNNEEFKTSKESKRSFRQVKHLGLDPSCHVGTVRQPRDGPNYQEILQNVNEINQNGNKHFKKSAYADALRKYKEGINLLLNYIPEFPADRMDKKRHLYKLFNNIAETFLRLQRPHLACATFEASVLHGVPFFNGKLHHKNANGLFEQKKFQEALKSLEESLRIEPGQTKVVTMRNQVLDKIKIATDQEADRKIKHTGVKGKSIRPKKVHFAEPISNKLLDQKLCSADKLTVFSFDVDVKLEF